MPPKLRPRQFVITSCTPMCTMHPRKNPVADALHEAFEAGMNDAELVGLSDKLGHHVSAGAFARHRARHLTPLHQAGVVTMQEMTEAGVAEQKKVDHVAVLELMIAKGARTAHTWRLGPSDTLKAIEMHHRLTQGRETSALMEALAAAAAGMSDEELYSADEIATVDEQEQAVVD